MRPRLAAAAALIACVCLLSGCAGSPAPAPSPSPTPAPSPEVTAAAGAAEKSRYEPVRVYFDSLLSDRAYEKKGVAYMSPRALCGFFGLDMELTETAEGVSGNIGGVGLRAEKGLEYMTADGRYLYIPGGYIEVGGELYFSCEAVCHIFGLTAVVGQDPLRVDIDTSGMTLITGGEDYYDTHFVTEDVYWLARLINSESKNEPLAGQIGVGNVVLNRVDSSSFPSTILAVIYDKGYGRIQFDSTVTGGIQEKPTEQSTIATYLCLEGFNTVGDSMYYVNPVTGQASWFERELTKTIVIGNHHFYK